MKPLEDGSYAVGFFNRAKTSEKALFNKFTRCGFKEGKLTARDLWRQKDLPDIETSLPLDIPAHGVLLLKVANK